MRLLLLCVICFCAVESAGAQNRWIVGPGGFATLEAAYQAAAPGDIILVRAPTLTAFTLTGKGMTILGDTPTGQRPIVQPRGLTGIPIDYESWIQQIPAGQQVYMENVEFDGGLVLYNSPGAIVLNGVVVQRSVSDIGLEGISCFSCANVICVHGRFRGSSDLAYPCQPVAFTYCGLFSAISGIYVGHSTIEHSYAGPAWCSTSFPQYRTLTALGVAGMIGNSATTPPVIAFASIQNCTLGGTGAFQLYLDACHLSISGHSVNLPIQLTASSAIRAYGNSVSVIGSGMVATDSLRLPGLRVTLTAQQLVVDAVDVSAGSLCFLGASRRAEYAALEPSGNKGTIGLDLDVALSGLIDVVQADPIGRWRRTYAITPAIAAALQYQVFLLQFYTLDAAGRLWASSIDIARF